MNNNFFPSFILTKAVWLAERLGLSPAILADTRQRLAAKEAK
ncbi:hypothetical protein [Levilactobacillus mulengensis]|nr:hypothetical protein [Levilactobacillus mulengensis]